MQSISFPALNLNLQINRVAFELFGIKIYWYAIFIVLAIVLAIFFFKKDDGKYGIKFENILEAAIFVIPIAIVCARIYYIVFNLNYYVQNPIKMFDLRNGGLAIYGGIIGGVITIYIYCKKKKIKFISFLDYIIPYLALGQAIGRWGNFVNVEAYGTQTTSFFRMGIFKEATYMEVHPTFLYESIIDFAIFIILYLFRNSKRLEGKITYIYLIIYCFFRFFIEQLRTDSLMLGNIRVSAIFSVILFIIGIIGLIFSEKNATRNL